MTSATDFDPFAGGEVLLTAPTTEPQQEIWLAIELGGREANLAYNESIALAFDGSVDAALLEQAVTDLAERHEALRTTFTADGQTFCVEARSRAVLRVDDLGALDPNAREVRRRAILEEEVNAAFDLQSGPLFRPRLVLLGPQQSELILTAHHMVCDGWSTAVLLAELPELYRARSTQQPAKLEAAPKFSDYAVAERRAAHGEEAAEAERYWLATLGAAPPQLDLPSDRPRPLTRDLAAAREDYVLDAALVGELRALAKSSGASLMAVLLAGFDALLHRLTGQTDFVVGMPAAGQAAAGLLALVGHCVNTLPVRVQFDPDAPFVDHVRGIKHAILGAVEHQQLSFGSLLKKLSLPRTPERVPLAPVIFNLDKAMPPVPVGAARVSFRTTPRAYDAFELFINATEIEGRIVLETTYSTALFEQATILRWLAELSVLLRGAIASPSTALGRLPVLPEDERQQLLVTWNATTAALPSESTALELIEAQVRRTPRAIAARDERGSLTYLELDRRANHIAHCLLALGVRPEECVGICLERSTRTLIGLLAIWKAGAAYVPLDPDYPTARLGHIAKDAALRVLVTEHTVAHVLEASNLQRVFIDAETGARDEAPVRTTEARQLAYVLHTSGSTGQPKGVQIEHRSLVNLLCSSQRWPGMHASDVLVAVTTLSFDIAGVELYLPLTVGAQVVIASREVARDGHALAALIQASSGTVVSATPVTWRFLAEAGFRGRPGFKAIASGERLPAELAADLLTRVSELWNAYGPTETTIWSTGTRIVPDQAITIGRPFANTRLYVLDAAGQPVPTGAQGELFIGGLGVARGYLNRPDLTAERFVADPFASEPGARMYRTGDLVRYDASGNLVYEGRNDGQVKVRGFRIELGEIESAMEQHASVRQSAVVLRELGPSDTRIVAYVVAAADQTIEVGALLDHLRRLLPSYMIPQHTMVLEALPLTPNGKIDRKALPTVEAASAVAESYVAPATSVHRQLVEIWRELLREARVGIRDSFFDLGGHSMLAVRMLSRVHDTLGVQLPVRTIFQAQTIEALSTHIEAALLSQGHGRAASEATKPLEEVEF